MFEKVLDFIARYLSGFFFVIIVFATFVGCLFVASLDSKRDDHQPSQRAKLCWQLRSHNCF